MMFYSLVREKQVRDNAYMLLRDQGAFIQEPVEGVQSGTLLPEQGETVLQEKEIIVMGEEKVEDTMNKNNWEKVSRKHWGKLKGHRF